MKLTNLLTGAAVAALLTGAANAQIASGNIDGNATNDLGASLVFASELDLTEAAPTGNVELTLGAAEFADLAALAATDSVTIKFDLSGGLSWDGNLSDANHIGQTATCEFNISAAGGTGTQTVSYALDGTTEDATTCSAATAQDDLGFTFPIEITGAGNISFTMSLTATGTVLSSGTLDVDAGTAGTQGYVRTAKAFTYTFADDATNESITLASSYELFGGGGVLGTLSGADTAGVIVAAANAGNTAADSSADAQVDGGELVVTFPQPAGIASVTLGLAAPETVALVGGSATFELSAAEMDQFDGASISITANEATGADAAPIANQQPTAVFTVSAPSASDLTVAGDSAVNNTDLDALLRQGSNTTTFEWVGDSAASTKNVFRAVGLGATLPTIRVTLSNSTADVDGEYVVTPAGTLTNGELILTEADIEAAVGSAFGRADVTFSFEAAGITVRRFLVGSNGTLADMGDDNG